MNLVLGTLLFSFGSAFVPVLNLEAYLVAVAAVDRTVSVVSIAVVSGVGQMIGKTIWFYIGRKALDLPWVRRRTDSPKWQATYQTWHSRIVGRPVVSGLVVFASGVGGVPPFAVVAVLAGALQMPVVLFVVTGLLGRTLRFYLVLVGVSTVLGD